jgi:hypothetical protein
MDDDGGVLGNLPRSRPGRRSQKRDSTARAAESAERRSAKAARPAAQTTARPATGRVAKPPPPAEGGDPVGEAVRLAAGIAQTGLQVASGLTREVLRRLPRP